MQHNLHSQTVSNAQTNKHPVFLVFYHGILLTTRHLELNDILGLMLNNFLDNSRLKVKEIAHNFGLGRWEWPFLKFLYIVANALLTTNARRKVSKALHSGFIY